MTVAINAIYRGSVTYASGDGTAPSAISLGGTIVTANSIVSITIRSSDNEGRARRHFWEYDLTTTTIAFIRTQSGSAKSVTIEWEVIEFDTGVSVQRGNEDFGTSASTHDITISAVTTADTIATLVAAKPANSVNNWSRLDTDAQHHYPEITSTTNLKITATATPSTAGDSWVDSWQVIEFNSDVAVQKGISASSGGSSIYDRTVSISAITLSRTLALLTGMLGKSTAANRNLTMVDFNSTTEIQIEMLNEGSQSDNSVSWATVELPSGSTVESGVTTILDTDTTPTTQPNWTTALDNGSLLQGYFFPNSKKNATGSGTFDGFMSSISLDSPEDSITVTRNGTSIGFDIAFFVGDWPSSSGPTTFFQTNTGSLTATGDLLKQAIISQNINSSLTPSGALSKQVSKSFSGSITPSGAIQKRIDKVLDGSLTPAGTLLAGVIILLSLAGQAIASGSLVTQFVPFVAKVTNIFKDVFKSVFSNVFKDIDE